MPGMDPGPRKIWKWTKVKNRNFDLCNPFDVQFDFNGPIWPYLSFKCFSDLSLIVTLYANSERTLLVGHYKYDTFVL